MVSTAFENSCSSLLKADFVSCSMGNATARYHRVRVPYHGRQLRDILSMMPVTRRERALLCQYFIDKKPEMQLRLPEDAGAMYFPGLVRKAADFVYGYWKKHGEE